ncbi:MAG: SDR family oxidoreductase [Rhodospirillaceae bacterium]|nr:MAG: SDR family oxidoreductase [Rhodospirillaceae bacterium]
MFQKDLLKGKRILVTGGGTGLGYSMGHRFLELGAELVICGRREEVLKEAAEKLMAETGGKVETHGCDIRDAEAVDKMIAAIWENGPLHSLVNNAAGNFISRTEDLSPRAVDAVLNIVLHGSAYATLACGKRWLKEGRKASVLSIVTTYAWTGSAYVVPSAMAKAGVLSMIRSLAVEWGGRGVRLNAIAPGPFPTKGAWERLVPRADLAKKFETNNPLQRVGDHGELANLATFLLSDFAGYINGEVVTIDGGEWLQGAGQFNFLREMTDADWESLKPKKK